MCTNDRCGAVLGRSAKMLLVVWAISALPSLTATAKGNIQLAYREMGSAFVSAQSPALGVQLDLRASELKCEDLRTARYGFHDPDNAEDNDFSRRKVRTAERFDATRGEGEPDARARSLGALLNEKWEILVAWTVTLLAVIFAGFMMWQQRRADRQVAALEQQVDLLAGKASMAADARWVAGTKKNSYTEEENAAPEQGVELQRNSGRSAAGQAPSEPLHRLAQAGCAIAAEALVCFASLESNKYFLQLNEVAKLRSVVVDAEARFRRLSETNLTPEDDPVVILRAGGFNDILTISPLIEAYFPDQDDWYEMCRMMSTLAELTRLLLARYGVEVYVVKPLTRLVHYRGEKETQDHRGIKKLALVRTAVSRQAAMINQGESLIVDCLAPGFIIPGAGSIPPRLCFYNPSAWS